MENQLINFVQKFFINLGAEVLSEGDVLTVSKVPAHFQKFYGKNEPYKFSIKIKNNPEIEFLEKGSYTMKTISAFLENSGQTTLLKIDFELNPEEEIKKRLKLENSRLVKLSPKKMNDIFFRFTFHTSFQYLNEKEKVINEIYVHDGKVINGDLNGYPVIEGKKTDIRIPDMKEPYFLAKEKLKELLIEKTNSVAEELNKRLEKEIERIEKHFKSEEKELGENLLKLEEKLVELKKEGDSDKIERQKKLISNIKEKLNFEERQKDKERSILIEKTKHGLNVNNKLFNTTLIYHPLFAYAGTLKNQNTEREILLVFNPLLEKLNPLICEVCKSEIKEFYLCSNSHVICENCVGKCQSCGKEYCKNCIKNHCEICGSYICDDCKTRCSKCGKIMCKSHTKIDRLTGKVYCNNCLTRCERCQELKVGEDFRKSKRTGAKICEDCFRKEMQKDVLGGVFD